MILRHAFLLPFFLGKRQGLCQFHVVHFRCFADQPVRSCCFQIEKICMKFVVSAANASIDLHGCDGLEWHLEDRQWTANLSRTKNFVERNIKVAGIIKLPHLFLIFVCFKVMVHQILRS